LTPRSFEQPAIEPMRALVPCGGVGNEWPRRAAALLVLCLAIGCRRSDPDVVEATGTLEVAEVDISPLLPARITRMWVDEGMRVRVGDTLVSLTTSSVLPNIEAQRARVSSAEATLRDLIQGARPAELDQLAAQLRAAEADAKQAASDAQRSAPLAAKGTISAQQYDALRSAATAAAARRDAAAEALRLAQEGTRPERIRAARAELANARAALAMAEGTASDLVLTSPINGSVMARHAEPGELLGVGEAALTLGDVSRPWVRVYVDQRLFPLIHIGDSAVARLDAFPNRPLMGRVVAVSDKAEFTPRIALTERERADLLFGVKVQFQDTTGLLKAGLPLTIRFATPGDRGAPTDQPARVPITSRP